MFRKEVCFDINGNFKMKEYLKDDDIIFSLCMDNTGSLITELIYPLRFMRCDTPVKDIHSLRE